MRVPDPQNPEALGGADGWARSHKTSAISSITRMATGLGPEAPSKLAFCISTSLHARVKGRQCVSLGGDCVLHRSGSYERQHGMAE